MRVTFIVAVVLLLHAACGTITGSWDFRNALSMCIHTVTGSDKSLSPFCPLFKHYRGDWFDCDELTPDVGFESCSNLQFPKRGDDNVLDNVLDSGVLRVNYIYYPPQITSVDPVEGFSYSIVGLLLECINAHYGTAAVSEWDNEIHYEDLMQTLEEAHALIVSGADDFFGIMIAGMIEEISPDATGNYVADNFWATCPITSTQATIAWLSSKFTSMSELNAAGVNIGSSSWAGYVAKYFPLATVVRLDVTDLYSKLMAGEIDAIADSEVTVMNQVHGMPDISHDVFGERNYVVFMVAKDTETSNACARCVMGSAIATVLLAVVWVLTIF